MTNRYIVAGQILPEEEAAWAWETLHEILTTVKSRHGVSGEELAGPQQHAAICDARFDLAERLYAKGFPLKEIGAVLGGRHHSTVINAVKNGQRMRAVWAA